MSGVQGTGDFGVDFGVGLGLVPFKAAAGVVALRAVFAGVVAPATSSASNSSSTSSTVSSLFGVPTLLVIPPLINSLPSAPMAGELGMS
jgi:hypothetical protein